MKISQKYGVFENTTLYEEKYYRPSACEDNNNMILL